MIRPSLYQYSVLGLRLGTPFLFCLFSIFLGLFPFRIPMFLEMYVPFGLIGLFYWTLFRPDLMPPWAVFILGLLSDLIFQNPIGLDTLLYVAFYMLVLSQRRFLTGRSFEFLWGAFAVIVAPLFILLWLLVSILLWRLLSLGVFVGQSILLIGFYPFFTALAGFLYEKYLDDQA